MFKQITVSHIKKHNIYHINTYKEKFSNAEIMSEDSHIIRSKIAILNSTNRFMSKETRKKISINRTGKLCGIENPAKRPEVRLKISNALTGKTMTEERRKIMEIKVWKNEERNKKISEKLSGREIFWIDKISKTKKIKYANGQLTVWNKNKKGLQVAWNKNLSKECQPRFGKKDTEETREKRSKSMINYLKNNDINILPNIGKNEKEILNYVENEIGFTIERQYKILNYFVDGYCKKLNTVFEVDEPAHNKQSEMDELREEESFDKLKCNYLRIQTW